jgi:hypothetical protein
MNFERKLKKDKAIRLKSATPKNINKNSNLVLVRINEVDMKLPKYRNQNGTFPPP